MKLLIVDDSVIIRNAIQKYLKDSSLEVVGMAGDGKTALELFQATMPDVVTLDVTMPEMDGLTVLDEIMELKPETKVLVITALTDEGTALDAMDRGATGFLKKPFSADKLKEAFEHVVDSEE